MGEGGRSSDSQSRGYVVRPSSNSLEIQLIESRTVSGKYNTNYVEFRPWDEEASVPQGPPKALGSA